MKKEIRMEVYNKFNGRCSYCGCTLEYKQMQVDHFLPKENFQYHILNKIVPIFLEHLTVKDLNHIDNLYPSCRPCNIDKHSMYYERWRSTLLNKIECLKRINNFRHMLKYGLVEIKEKPIVFHFETQADTMSAQEGTRKQ